MIEKDLKSQIIDSIPISNNEKRFQRQENQIISELNIIEIEICAYIEKIISAKWNAPSLQCKVESLMIQRHKMWIELDLLWGFK